MQTKSTEEIPREIYIPPEKMQNIVDGLKLIWYINIMEH